MSILIIFILIILIITFYKTRASPNKDEALSNKELDRRIEFLLKQFSKTNLELKEEYLLPKGFNKITKENIEYVFKNIIEHINLKGNLLLIYHRQDEKMYRDKAGTYDQGPLGYKVINIVLNSEYTMNDYIATLAHECSHHFMETEKFEKKFGIENEKNTDTLAVLLGFGKFLQESNKIRSVCTGSTFDAGRVTKHFDNFKLGYLTSEEIYYIYKKYYELKKAKKEKEEFKTEKKEVELKKIKMKMNFLIKAHEKNKEALDRIITTKNLKNIKDKKDLEKISELLHIHQSKIYDIKIKEFRKALKNYNKNKDHKLCDGIVKVTREIENWNSLLSIDKKGKKDLELLRIKENMAFLIKAYEKNKQILNIITTTKIKNLENKEDLKKISELIYMHQSKVYDIKIKEFKNKIQALDKKEYKALSIEIINLTKSIEEYNYFIKN